MTWGGLLLFSLYTSLITTKFVVRSIVWPMLELLVRVTNFANRHVPNDLVMGIFRKYREHCISAINILRQWKWRFAGSIFAFVMLRLWHVGSCAVSWVQGWPWWWPFLLPLAPPSLWLARSASNAFRSVCLCAFYVIISLLEMAIKLVGKATPMLDRPVTLPFCGNMPKCWLWRAYLELASVYESRVAILLFRVIACCTACSCLHSSPARLPPSASPLITYNGEDAWITRCTTKNTPRFIPDVRRGKVTSIYDGDTLTVAARHAEQGQPSLFSVRLLGIDTPEIRGAASAGERRAALAARDALRAAVLGKLVTVDVRGVDKYGRLLASVTGDFVGDLSSLLLDAGHAVPYDGRGPRGAVWGWEGS